MRHDHDKNTNIEIRYEGVECRESWLYNPNEWNEESTTPYQGNTYSGCVETPDWLGNYWCIVKDNTCSSAQPLQLRPELRWRR